MEIKIRQKPQRSTGKTSLVLEYYYGYTRDDEGRIKHRRKFETLEYYLYTDPKNKLERDHNKVNLEMAEKVKAKRLLAEQNEEPRLPTSASAAKYIASLLFGRKTECLYLICLDASYRVLYKCIVMEGSIDFVPVSTREIVSIALRHNATRLILAHNHPGGSPLPSRQDILVTQKLVHALAQIDIQLSDHIIIAGREYYSFADKHSHVNPMLSRETNGAADNYLGVVYLPEEDPAAHTE